MGSDRSFLGSGIGKPLSGALCRNSYSLSVGGGNLTTSIKSPSSGLAPREASAPEIKPSSTSGLKGGEKGSSTCSTVSSVHWMGMENCFSAETNTKYTMLFMLQNTKDWFSNNALGYVCFGVNVKKSRYFQLY